MRHLSFICWIVSIGSAIVLSECHCRAEDWSRFRGPNGTGVASDAKQLPTTWSPTKNLRWKVKLPGVGVSSPIVVSDRVFVTCYSGYGLDRSDPGDMKKLKRHLVCVERTKGKILWEKVVPPVLPEEEFIGMGVTVHGYASHTPVSDGKRVYVFFGKTGALAFDWNGKQLWQTSVGTGTDLKNWGTASSPILYKNLLILSAAPESRSIVALNTETGQQVWQTKIDRLTNHWGTPVLVKVNADRTDLVLGTEYETWGFDPDSGKKLWVNKSICACKSSVTTSDGIVYAVESSFDFTEGRVGSAGAIRAGGEDDTSKTHTLWTNRTSNSFGTPVIYRGKLYTISRGILTCLDAKTGKEIYKSRLRDAGEVPQKRPKSRYGRGGDFSSPVIANGNLYFVQGSGATHVIKTGDRLTYLSVNRVTNEAERFCATPAISDGEIFLRSDKHLYCVSSR